MVFLDLYKRSWSLSSICLDTQRLNARLGKTRISRCINYPRSQLYSLLPSGRENEKSRVWCLHEFRILQLSSPKFVLRAFASFLRGEVDIRGKMMFWMSQVPNNELKM